MADVYRIGVSIAMSNGVSSVLKVIQRDMLGLHRTVNMTTLGFDRMKVAAAGAFAVAGGVAMLGVMGKLVHASEEYNRQLTLMKQAGMSAPSIAAARQAANTVSSQVAVSTPAGNMQLIRELRGVFGKTSEATAFLPDFAKTQAILQQVTGRSSPHDMQTLAKAIELRGDVLNAQGKIDPAAFRAGLNQALRTLVAAGGLISPTDLYSVMQQAGPMARMMSSQQFYDTMMPAIMEMGGRRAGTALTAIGRAVYGGIMPQRNAFELERLGLVDPSKVHVRRGGQITTDMGAFRGTDILDHQGLLAYVQKVLRPALEHAGYTTNKAQQAELYRLYPTETARRLISLFLQQAQTVLRDQRLRAVAHGIGSYDWLIESNLGMAHQAFTAQLSRIATDLGNTITPTVTRTLNLFAHGLAAVAHVIEANQPATRYLLLALGGIATALTVLGGLAIGAAAFASLATIGIGAGAIAAILGMAAALPVLVAAGIAFAPRIAAWVRMASDALAAAALNIGGFLSHLWTTITERLTRLASAVWDGIMGLAAKIADAIRAMLAHMLGFLSTPLTAQQKAQQGRLLGPQYGAPHDGFDESGRPVAKPQSYERFMPTVGQPHVTHVTVTLDGEVVGRAVSQHQGRAANAPSRGPTGWNLGIGLPPAGALVAI